MAHLERYKKDREKAVYQIEWLKFYRHMKPLKFWIKFNNSNSNSFKNSIYSKTLLLMYKNEYTYI